MLNYLKKVGSVALIIIGLLITGCSVAQAPASVAQVALASEITVFRSPTCGCCELWGDHMRDAGFQVSDRITEEMTAVKDHYGVPESLRSCHTTVVDGYIIEGHVPAADVARLLTEQPPEIAGLAAPGMPVGSPGMESGSKVDPYTVFAFDKTGRAIPFSKHA